MSQLKYLLAISLIFSVLSLFGQSNEPVLLRWKLKPGEKLAYKTTMQPLDTPNMNISFSGLFKTIGKDSAAKSADDGFKKMAVEMLKENKDFIISLNRNKNGIAVEMHNVSKPDNEKPDSNKADSDLIRFKALMKQNANNVTLRGEISDDGSVQSFYLNSPQKNLIAAMFRLPSKPVKIGDSWPLDVNFISMDQNFICDSSYRSDVCTLTDIVKTNGEHIATIKYNIVEYVSGKFTSPFSNEPEKMTMSYSHIGIANFSIERGRWIDYKCVISNESSGVMTGNGKSIIALSEK